MCVFFVLFCFFYFYFIFEERYFIFKVGVVKQFKFRRGSVCLASDEFLVIFKGDHILICMYIFAIVCYCWALYYAAQRSLYRVFPFVNLLESMLA